MKLFCTQENFKQAIYNCERVVAKQNTLPILNNILFETKKSGLYLSATNLEMGAQVKIGAKIEEEGSIAVPVKLLSGFVNNLPPEETVFLESVGQNLKIRSGSTKAVIKGFLPGDFPLIPQKNSELILVIPGKALKTALSRVMVSVAFNEARQELTGVNLVFEKNEIFLASTDSFRLSECVLKKEDGLKMGESYGVFMDKNNSIIVPASTFIELSRIIPPDSPEEIGIAIEEGQIFFEFVKTSLVSRLISGKYPEYKHIMPKEYGTKVVGDKKALQGAVKRAGIFASGKTSEISLKIDAEAKKIYIRAESGDTGENSTELDFEVSGKSQEVVFNSKYLLDGINMVESSSVALLLNSGETPMALRYVLESGEISEGYTYIVMPIKN